MIGERLEPTPPARGRRAHAMADDTPTVPARVEYPEIYRPHAVLAGALAEIAQLWRTVDALSKRIKRLEDRDDG
jgi:ubiquinone biosynthesis protein UbiJ